MARVGEIDRTVSREGHAMASVPRWQHTVEHVDAACYGFDEIVRRTDPHQVARTIRRQQRRSRSHDPEHHVLRLADSKTADGVAVEAHRGECAGTFLAQREVVATLHDPEQRVAVACIGLKRTFAALGPSQR